VDTATHSLKTPELALTSNLFAPPSSSELSKSAAPRKTYHTVRSGETLSAIARKYKTTVAKIIKLNNLKNPDRLSIGQKIRVK
jgi:LysM repeat protein